MDLRHDPPARAEHVALVVSEERPEYAELRARLQSSPSGRPSVEFCHVPAAPQPDYQEMMLVSGQLLQAMASVLTRRAA
jgi:hypothetical protein